MNKTPKRILVTGGAGFIGSHLCERLLEEGHEVLCLDNLFTGRRENIAHLLGNPRFEFIRHDIIQPTLLEVDEIYNLACPASPIHYQYNPVKTIKTNVMGVLNMLGLAKRVKARLLQASTSEVYGDPDVHPQKEDYWGNVNPIGLRACYSADTQVLTAKGWKYFSDISRDDECLTVNGEGQIEYQKPIEIIKEYYNGEMISFKNSKIDLLVTPNHRMYVARRDAHDFELIPAFESIRWERSEMRKSAEWTGQEVEWFVLPDVKNAKKPIATKIKMNDWLEFFGYFVTEGCVHIRKRGREVGEKVYEVSDYNILIAQDRKNKIQRERIRRCLERLPFKYYDSDDHQFRICNKQLAEYLIQFGKSKERFIPVDLKSLSKQQLKILFDAMMLGDGSKGGRAFYSSSERLIGDMQEILLKLGMSGNVNIKDRRSKNIGYHLHILHDKKRDFLTPKYPKRVIEGYDGYVYCVNVPNHVIYVRRNGKALFCGNCYDEGKRCAESLMFAYHRQNGVDIRVVRIFNTYGPRMLENDGRVVSNFIVQALKGEDITVYGDGHQTRSFCYVDDMIDGMIRMMEQDDLVGPVNLGNPREFTILELARRIKEMTGSTSEIVFKPLPPDDPVQRQPDIRLAVERLHWRPKVDLEEGLDNTIRYFRERSNK